MTIWRMRIACWITNVADIHSEYVILIALPQQQWLHERNSTLRYAHIVCLITTYMECVYRAVRAGSLNVLQINLIV
jgi:hypothetical protein